MGLVRTAERYHDISCGHRVVGHEGKCALMHGHNYRIHFMCEAVKLDSVGRVIDFSVIKSRLCMWLEEHWDHKFLAWDEDPDLTRLADEFSFINDSMVFVPFNPTAENMADHLLLVIGPQQLVGTQCTLTGVKVEETRKCTASALLFPG